MEDLRHWDNISLTALKKVIKGRIAGSFLFSRKGMKLKASLKKRERWTKMGL